MPTYYLCTDQDQFRAQLPEREVNLPLNLNVGDWLQFKNTAGLNIMGLITAIKHSIENPGHPPLMFISDIVNIPPIFQDTADHLGGAAGSVQLKLQDVTTNTVFKTLEIRPEDFRYKKGDTLYTEDGSDFLVDELIYASGYNASGYHHAIARVKRQTPPRRSSVEIGRQARDASPQANRAALLQVGAAYPDPGYASNRASPAAVDPGFIHITDGASGPSPATPPVTPDNAPASPLEFYAPGQTRALQARPGTPRTPGSNGPS